MTHDKAGRAYAKLSELKAGDKIELDEGFDCALAGITEVTIGHANALCFPCNHGLHYLEGQTGSDDDTLIGIYRV